MTPVALWASSYDLYASDTDLSQPQAQRYCLRTHMKFFQAGILLYLLNSSGLNQAHLL